MATSLIHVVHGSSTPPPNSSLTHNFQIVYRPKHSSISKLIYGFIDFKAQDDQLFLKSTLSVNCQGKSENERRGTFMASHF